AASLPVNVIRHRWRRNLDPAPYMAPIPVFASTHGETPGGRGAADPSWPCSPVPERAKPAFFPASASRTPATSLPLNGTCHPWRQESNLPPYMATICLLVSIHGVPPAVPRTRNATDVRPRPCPQSAHDRARSPPTTVPAVRPRPCPQSAPPPAPTSMRRPHRYAGGLDRHRVHEPRGAVVVFRRQLHDERVGV